jgi:hypothetical protein
MLLGACSSSSTADSGTTAAGGATSLAGGAGTGGVTGGSGGTAGLTAGGTGGTTSPTGGAGTGGVAGGSGGAASGSGGEGGLSAGGGGAGGAGGSAGSPPVIVGDPVNVSTGKTCQSSANFTPNLPCELALDGTVSQESRWESEQGVDDGWMYVDLGATYAVTEIDVYWEHSGALVHEAQVWTQYGTPPTDVDTDWVPVAREENLANGESLDLIESLYPIDPVVTQYVRIRCFERMWQWGHSIFELDVFGVPAQP